MKKVVQYSIIVMLLALSGTIVYAEDTQVQGDIPASTDAHTGGPTLPNGDTRPGIFELKRNRMAGHNNSQSKKPQNDRVTGGNHMGSTSPRDMQRDHEINGDDHMSSTTLENRRSEIKSKIELKIDKQRENIGKMRRNQFTGMIERFDRTISRLKDILIRLETRITSIKIEGGVVASTTDSFIVKTHADIGLAETSFASLTDLASSTILTTTSTTKIATSTLLNLRKLSEETQKHIRDAQLDMEKALFNLRGGKGEMHATTTEHSNI